MNTMPKPPLKATPVKPETPQEAATRMATEMMQVIEDLVAVMAEEITLVEKRAVKEHGILLLRKQQLTVNYRAGMKILASQPDTFRELPEYVRAKLKASAQKLADVSERNARHLRGAVIATQRLVRTFVDLVREEVSVKSGYNMTKSGNILAGDYSQVCKPIAVNRTA